MESEKAKHSFPSGQKLIISQGDITRVKADAIVNAANNNLIHGGGVAAAIVRRGGKVIQEESREWVNKHGPITHEKPAYTSSGELESRYVIHAVGPVLGESDGDQKLADAVMGCLSLAEDLGLESIALPAISTGIYGFPLDRAANIFIHIIGDFCQKRPDSSLRKIKIVLFDENALNAFMDVFHKQFENGS